ncbi:hypothetical protein E3P99_03400 [Wallemia hederae]|uniref:DNA-(apurinic or apyrimidinic site) endonuclease n=1 Tax=Wallemia hederae TaxID=1540922 RepID=A0A4T0FGA5_9BASI|nr:hypothetical protein E3P99_03400 [Wallemia hederae]
MRILSWNINGIRRVLGHHSSCAEMVRGLNADIVCFQVKSALTPAQAIVDGFPSYWSFCHSNRSYSGVCVYSSTPALAAEEGLSGGYTAHSLGLPNLSSEHRVQPAVDTHTHTRHDLLARGYDSDYTNIKQLDTEGRALAIDYGLFVLLNVYCPAEGEEHRGRFKRSFHEMLYDRIQALTAAGRHVVLLGDINIAHRPIDHCDGLELARTDVGRTQFSEKSTRKWMDKLVSGSDSPLVDVARLLHPDREGMYTCWNQLINARPSNYGTRIDYVLVSPGLLPWIKHADIAADVMHSDHCPVYIDLHDQIQDPEDDSRTLYLRDLLPDKETPLPSICALNWNEFNGKQTSLASFLKSAKNEVVERGGAKEGGGKKATDAHAQDSDDDEVEVVEVRPSTARRVSSTPAPTRRSHTPSKRSQQPQIESFFQPRQRSASGGASNQSTLTSHAKRQRTDSNTSSQPPSHTTPPNNTATKSAWKALMAPKKAPRCKVHNETCKEYTVNKPGPNKGKQFWLCSRNVGPGYDAGGAKRNRADVDSRYRCNFFVWSSQLERDLSGVEGGDEGVDDAVKG